MVKYMATGTFPISEFRSVTFDRARQSTVSPIAMTLHEHIISISHYKCYYIKFPEIKIFYKIKYLNNVGDSRKNEDCFWMAGKQ